VHRSVELSPLFYLRCAVGGALGTGRSGPGEKFAYRRGVRTGEAERVAAFTFVRSGNAEALFFAGNLPAIFGSSPGHGSASRVLDIEFRESAWLLGVPLGAVPG
jgi:hypothetical protein